MKQFKLTLGFILLTVGIITFTGCSKYEEGPFFSLRTKRSRVVGDWKATAFTVDGEDYLNYSSTETFECMSGEMFNFNMSGNMSINWVFENDGNTTITTISDNNTLDYANSYVQCEAIYTANYDENIETAKWDFSSNKEDIEITYLSGSIEKWHIIELREKQMKLTMEDGSYTIGVTLEPK
jgi:hypothetical protein